MEIPEHLRNSAWEYDLVDDLQPDPAQRTFAAAKLGYSRFVFRFASRGQVAAGDGFSRLRQPHTNPPTFSLRVASPIGWP
jgi:hypothetical protein